MHRSDVTYPDSDRVLWCGASIEISRIARRLNFFEGLGLEWSWAASGASGAFETLSLLVIPF
jgi:hypothetical protein